MITVEQLYNEYCTSRRGDLGISIDVVRDFLEMNPEVQGWSIGRAEVALYNFICSMYSN